MVAKSCKLTFSFRKRRSARLTNVKLHQSAMTSEKASTDMEYLARRFGARL
jgi:hypothetical protein